jgi:hypothetical protein
VWNQEKQELKREIEKMSAVIEVQAKKIKTKTKITNSGFGQEIDKNLGTLN